MKPSSTAPETIAAVFWIDEAERNERVLPDWVIDMRECMRRKPPRKRPRQISAWASANRPSEN